MKENYKGKIDFLNNGHAYLKIEDSEQQLFIHKKNTLNALHLDTVEVSTFQKDGKIEAKVEKIIERYKKEWVGTVHRNKKITFVIPDSPKCQSDFFIYEDKTMGAKDNQKVIVEFVNWKVENKSPHGKIIKILGEIGDNNTEMNSIMCEYGLPVDFPIEVEKEANSIPKDITQEEISKRKDLRGVVTIGIDPMDAKDADDTLSLEIFENYYNIYVNIADVSHYVKIGSKLEKEAYRRGFSVYLVDRVIPMLPHILSNGVCSLKSGSDKLSFSVLFKMDKNGNILNVNFMKSIIYVDKDYSYEEAQEVIENGIRKDNEKTDSVILVLNDLAKKIRKRRLSNSLEINSSEVKFKMDDNGKPTGVYIKEQKDSNKLIEEFMLLSNQNVAKFIKSKGLPCVSRVHDDPDDRKLLEIKMLAENFGYQIDLTDNDRIKENLNKLMLFIKDKPEENIIKTLIVRSQKKACYSTTKHKHFGIGVNDYSHFTSCIRRYPDYLVHILLEKALSIK